MTSKIYITHMHTHIVITFAKLYGITHEKYNFIKLFNKWVAILKFSYRKLLQFSKLVMLIICLDLIYETFPVQNFLALQILSYVLHVSIHSNIIISSVLIFINYLILLCLPLSALHFFKNPLVCIKMNHII